MERKDWIKKYGIHVLVCMIAVGVAFWVNRWINIERNHVYTASKPIYTLLEEITEVKIKGNRAIFMGWCFDIDYNGKNSKCELILQDTETGESFWPKMEKYPQTVKIEERYTNGKEDSVAVFEGSIRIDKLEEDKVYEILLRYILNYVDENGKKQQYVRTVTTDEFFYQGKLKEYNAKTFIKPEIKETELEKELENAKLFHYFPEGMWLYYNEENLYYIVDKKILEEVSTYSFPLFWHVRNKSDLPEDMREYGRANSGFYANENEVFYDGIDNYKVWKKKFPSHKIMNIQTGLYNYQTKKWVFVYLGQLKGELHE